MMNPNEVDFAAAARSFFGYKPSQFETDVFTLFDEIHGRTLETWAEFENLAAIVKAVGTSEITRAQWVNIEDFKVENDRFPENLAESEKWANG